MDKDIIYSAVMLATTFMYAAGSIYLMGKMLKDGRKKKESKLEKTVEDKNE